MRHTEKNKHPNKINPKKWKELELLAKIEGRSVEALIDEALGDYIKKKPRKLVMDAFESSLEKYDDLYKLLAE